MSKSRVRGPPGIPRTVAASIVFDAPAPGQQLVRSQHCIDRDRTVEKPLLRDLADRFGLEPPRTGRHARPAQATERLHRRQAVRQPVSDIGSYADVCSNGFGHPSEHQTQIREPSFQLIEYPSLLGLILREKRGGKTQVMPDVIPGYRGNQSFGD
jgi:hypothetical protein